MKNTRHTGDIGEQIACDYLTSIGYVIVCRNYLKKWGEIDIICKKSGSLHFIEVKSINVTHIYSNEKEIYGHNIVNDRHKPEENVHNLKLQRLARTIETYLLEFNKGHDVEFLVHVVCVYMNTITNKSKIEMIENVII